MHCHDYQAEPMRSCCATTIGELHAPDCNRTRERRMVAGAEARVRHGQDQRRGDREVDWRPATRIVSDITMWDAPHDAAATEPVSEPDAAGYSDDDFFVDDDGTLDRFVSRLRIGAWLVVALPIGSCGAFRAGASLAEQLAPAPSLAGEIGRLATVILAAAGLAAIASSIVGARESR